MSAEFEIIERYFCSNTKLAESVRLGIGDDAAITSLPAGSELVTATDALIEGTHFLPGAPPESVGHRCLAVNLSDIAAMGAKPLWASLALTMPAADEDWLEGFAKGFFELADAASVALIGGDTVRGPLSVVVTVQGMVTTGKGVERGGATPGDSIYVTGSPGDAAAGRRLLQDVGASMNSLDEAGRVLAKRFYFPEPRLEAGAALRDIASAMIDISDGLDADLGRLLAASGCGAAIDLEALPLSAEIQSYAGVAGAQELALLGGEDYELCFTVAADCETQFIIFTTQ